MNIRSALQNSFELNAGAIAGAITSMAASANDAAQGLWQRDPSIWSKDAAVQQMVADRLGWLTSPSQMARETGRLRAFADSVVRDGFTDVVLLGMGGSSLAPEVLRAILGTSPGRPRFQMLDSTDPAAVLAAATPAATTLYILASKSGTTIEPNSLAAHFRNRLTREGVADWNRHFVAITDEGTQLAARARDEKFRDVFINPSDIGGRYSALSFFGLVPAALMGQNVDGIVGWAAAMIDEAIHHGGDATSNPAVALGLAMAAAARQGRDKLTLLFPPTFEPLGLWIEQLVAESTGKKGVGVVPVAGEQHPERARYGHDRFFVRMVMSGDASAAPPPSPHEPDSPVATLHLQELPAIGAEFVRWEIATAIAGVLLGINPFDEPNVQQAKDATNALLLEYKSKGRLPVSKPDGQTPDGVTFALSGAARRDLRNRKPEEFLALLKEGDYFAVLAYLGPDAAIERALQEFRSSVRDRRGVATMLGYGPRYLHSTGQLYKGGPNSGVFVLITATPKADVEIPEQPFTFGTLELAQALGDFASLDDTGRRALHVHLPDPDPGLIARVCGAMVDLAG